MLHELNKIIGLSIISQDGECGHVEDFYFDEEKWVIRYLIINTNEKISRSKAFISPIAISHFNLKDRHLQIKLTKQAIEDSPQLEAHRSITRKHETEYFNYFQWPTYWGHIEPWVLGPYGIPWKDYHIFDQNIEHHSKLAPKVDSQQDQSYLKRASMIKGMALQGADQELGTIVDFILYDKTWSIRYLIVKPMLNTDLDTDLDSTYSESTLFLVATAWIDDIDWKNKKIFVAIESDQFLTSPSFDSLNLNQKFEEELLNYYSHRPDDLKKEITKIQEAKQLWPKETFPSSFHHHQDIIDNTLSAEEKTDY